MALSLHQICYPKGAPCSHPVASRHFPAISFHGLCDTQLETEREVIPVVPAIYLLPPFYVMILRAAVTLHPFCYPEGVPCPYSVADRHYRTSHVYLSWFMVYDIQLETEREAIPDVPAIYFCRPTAENMRRIAADSGKRLYR